MSTDLVKLIMRCESYLEH